MKELIPQLIVWLFIFASIALIVIYYKRLPKKLARALQAAAVFACSASLATNYLRYYVYKLTQESDILKVFYITWLALIALSFLVVYLAKDERTERQIFFTVALVIFSIAYARFTINVFNDSGSYPGHLCRQTAYAFPVVYFGKYLRKYLLPFYCYAGIIGAFLTLFAPYNVLMDGGKTWSDIDTLIAHLAILLVPIILLCTKEVKPKLHDCWQFVLLLGASTLFAHLSNYIVFKQTGKWANYMYLTEPVVEGVHFLIFGTVVIAMAFAIILPFCIGEIKALKAKLKAKKDTNLN